MNSKETKQSKGKIKKEKIEKKDETHNGDKLLLNIIKRIIDAVKYFARLMYMMREMNKMALGYSFFSQFDNSADCLKASSGKDLD